MAHASIIRPVKLTTTFPEDIRVRLDLHLFSEIEQRVPKGAYQAFLVERIRKFFSNKQLQLPSGAWIEGPPEAIAFVEELLNDCYT
jgi:hypothetical protein